MKKFLSLAFVALLFTACQKDYDNTTTSSSAAGAASASYFPLTAGSTWLHRSQVFGEYTTTVLPGDTIIDNKKFSIVTTLGGARQFYHQQGGNISSYGQSFGGVPVPNFIVLKEGGLGTKWTNTLTSPGAVSTFNSEIKAVGLTRTVLGKQYKDVIQVEIRQTVTAPGFGTFDAGTYVQFYAKGVGAIEGFSQYDFMGLTPYSDTTRLVSYTIK